MTSSCYCYLVNDGWGSPALWNSVISMELFPEQLIMSTSQRKRPPVVLQGFPKKGRCFKLISRMRKDKKEGLAMFAGDYLGIINNRFFPALTLASISISRTCYQETRKWGFFPCNTNRGNAFLVSIE